MMMCVLDSPAQAAQLPDTGMALGMDGLFGFGFADFEVFGKEGVGDVFPGSVTVFACLGLDVTVEAKPKVEVHVWDVGEWIARSDVVSYPDSVFAGELDYGIHASVTYVAFGVGVLVCPFDFECDGCPWTVVAVAVGILSLEEHFGSGDVND